MQKTNFYNEINKNKYKSGFLILLVIGFLIFLGYVLGFFFLGNPIAGVVIAMAVSLFYILIGYYAGQNIILKASGAKEVQKKEYPYLFNTVEGLSIAAGIPMPKLYVIKEDSPNAFATGRDPKHASVTVTTGLLNLLNREELEGVIAHELSHIKNYDVRIMMLTTVLVGALVLISDFFVYSTWFSGGNRDRGNGHIIMFVIAFALAILTPIIGELMKLAVSRKREFLADANGALLTRYPKGLANALRKISSDSHPDIPGVNKATAHLWIESPLRGKKGFVTNLFSTHPPISERIKRLESM